MKIKVITVTNAPQHPGCQQLTRSLDVFGYDYHVIQTTWRGFGTKINEAAKYAESIQGEYSHILLVDAHDVIFLAPPDAITARYNDPDRMLFSCEKACWPSPGLASHYPFISSDWRYLNSGSYLAPIPVYLDMIGRHPVAYTYDDQLYFTERYLSGQWPIDLDDRCRIFQSIAFQADSDFETVDGRAIFNNKTGTYPTVIHGNGRTPMGWVYEILP